MNHIYRLVWSQVRRTWLVVSELARGRGKAGRTSTPRRTRSAWWAALPLSLPMLALAAAPAGITAIDAARPAAAIVAVRPALAPTVIAPVASSTHPTGGQVIVGTGHIDYGDHLTTIQQHSQRLSLNWLSFNIGADSTVNFLQPNAQSIAVNRIADPNGSVILGHLNANGQVFLINPNGVLFGQGAQVNVGGLVASTLDVSDSALDRGTLHFGGAGGGSVTNRGTITAAPGGYVALLGHAVSNQGAIHTPAGSVALAGGSAVTLSFDGNRLLDMQIDASTLNTLAENKQLIVAYGGKVLMSAGAKNSLLASVVNNTGTIQARTVENRAGKIVLLGGMTAGTTHVAGTLDASAPNGGDGGFVETSAAHVQVADGTKITTLAAAGNNGTWLIDPQDFTIAADKAGTVAAGTPSGDISGNTLTMTLGSGNVTILSSQGSTAGSGNINVNDAVGWAANTLTLTATNNININAVMIARGSAGLVLNPATGNGSDAAVGGGTVNVMSGSGRVDFTGGGNTLSIGGTLYTIITSLGIETSATATDLQGINGYLAGYYALGANIDAGATAVWNSGYGFIPIGNSTTPFTGSFDGLGHTISGLTTNRPDTDYVGLFGYAGPGSAIRNLGLLGGEVSGSGLVGALVGFNNNGTISHAYATGAVYGSHDSVGGLVGAMTGGTITQSYATGAVKGNSRVAGLVGYNDNGKISQSYATGAVTGSDSVGGLVGDNGGTIDQSYATGTVKGSGNYVGGLVGDYDSGAINQTYATGAVSGSGTGGLVGFYFGGTITDSYWDTETTGQSTSNGGTGLTTAGIMQLATFASWGADIDAQGGTGTAWRIYEGHTAPLLRNFLTPHTASAQPDFDGSAVALANVASSSITVPTDPKILGSVTGGDTLTLAGLAAGGGYTATSNADLFGLYSTQQGYDLIGSASRTISTPGSAAGEVRLINGADWNSGTLAIATVGNINIAGALNGDALHLNGGGTITDTAALNVASFVLGGGNWQQLSATLPAFSATDFTLASGSFVRALGGDGSSATPYQLADVYGLQGMGTLLANSFTLSKDIDASGTTGWNAGAGFAPIGNDSTTAFTGTFDGLGHAINDLTINRPTQDNVGLFGFVGGTVLRNIGLVGGSVSGADYVGGLVGHRGGSGSISNAYATGNVSGNNSVGGLVGALGGGSLSQSYATGNVRGVAAGSSYIGGLAGYLDGDGNISSLLNVNDVYATGNVSAGVSGSSATGSYIGGLAGFSSANISNAYATGNISISGYGMRSYIGGLVGYSGSTLENVHATGNINLITGQYLGGLVGINAFPYGRITYAYATGNITAGTADDFGGANYVGGLVGQNDGILDKVYATGNLEAPRESDSMLMYAGGLVGRNGESVKPGTISNAYATGNVDGGIGDYLGGLVGQNYGPSGNNYIANAYSVGRVIGSGYNVGGVVGFGGSLQNVYWNTETAGQSIPGSHATLGVIGLTSAQMLQVGSFDGLNTYAFFCVTCGAGISATGGTGAVWRIYEGHTMPLLSGFLTPYTVNAQPDFDGSGAALANIASVTVPTDPKILGNVTGGDALTLAGLAAGGGYTATSNANLSGLYSTQQGYDFIGSASRTISTPGSAAGEVRLDNGAIWSSGTLAIATAGNINIVGALNGDALRLNSGGTITDTYALNVASFVLSGGNWQQLGSLPTFSATDFSLTGGSFVRALGGDGSSGNPWQLTDVYGLQGAGTLLGDSFTLGNNIDANAATGWNGGAGFAPIGNSTTAFTGSIDGLGHTISDLTINRPDTDYVGLFGYTSTGSTISNVGLLSGSTTGRSEIGSLAGYNNGTINQAYATGAVRSSSYSGGLVGYNTGTINLAYATGAVNSSSYSGGLVGYNNKGTISQAYATGTVSGAAGSGNSSLGGLVGANLLGAISQAYATGAVNGGTANRVGGLVGWDDRGMIDQVYATGAVNGGDYVGGLVGFGSGSISRTYATGAVSGVDYVGGLVGVGQTGSISQAYATGAVSGRNYLGGLVGSGGSFISGSYWDMETTGQTYGCSCFGDVTGLTTAQMMDPARFISWGIATAGGSTSVWRTYAGHTAPLLRAFMTPLALGSGNVSLVYNGSDQTSSSFTYGTLTPGFWLPSASIDASLILGGVGTTMNVRNVGTYTLDLNPYSGQMGYDIDYTAGALTITPTTLTLSAVGDSKAYNGTTNSAGMVTIGGLLAGDSLAGLTQSFASKNVLGTNASTLGVDAGFVLDDGNGGGNYIIATHTAAGTITPYVVDLGGSRVYDGSTAVDAGDLVLGTLVGNETLTLSGTGSMADKNVGSGKSFALGTLALSDGTGNAANYILAGGNDTVDISRRVLTVDAIGMDKVYDGSIVDSVNLSSTGILIGDIVDFTGTGTFADKNVGTGKTVSISGIAATGNDAGNYSFSTTANTTADITAKTITVDATGSNKVYDGSTADAVMLASTGVLSGDTVNFAGTGSFADKNVGTAKAVGVNGIAASGADAGNYSYNTAATTTADITAKTITVDATGVDKVYDGNTAATISALSPTGLVSGDVLTFSNTSATFDDKNAGTDKAITINGITATGADAGNYSFGTTTNTTATISQFGITVDATGSNKAYDGSTIDAVTLAGTGVLSGDTVNFTGTGNFADKSVGTGKTVSVSSIAASGTDVGNYSFNTTATTTADITAKTITVDATGTNKVYDGSTADAVALASAGVLSGDVVNFTGTGSFADKNVGTAKAVGVSGIAASGADAGNYSYNTSATTTADVTPATLTYHADTAHFQTGQMPGDLSGAVTGLVGGDTLANATEGTLAWQTPATASSPAGLYAIDGSGLSALNYLFEQASGNATALHVINGSASRVVTTIIAGLQQDETSPDDNANTLHAPSVRIVDGGVRLP